MDFELTIHIEHPDSSVDVETRVFYTPDTMLAALHDTIGTWNNFQSDCILTYTLKKIPSEGETLGVGVVDTINWGEQLS